MGHTKNAMLFATETMHERFVDWVGERQFPSPEISISADLSQKI